MIKTGGWRWIPPATFTNSPDFNFTSGSFQSTYGGDPYDGVVIQEQLS
jgi:hypothetical protein